MNSHHNTKFNSLNCDNIYQISCAHKISTDYIKLINLQLMDIDNIKRREQIFNVSIIQLRYKNILGVVYPNFDTNNCTGCSIKEMHLSSHLVCCINAKFEIKFNCNGGYEIHKRNCLSNNYFITIVSFITQSSLKFLNIKTKSIYS